MKSFVYPILIIALVLSFGASVALAAGACEKKINGAWAYTPEDPKEKEMVETVGGMTFVFNVESNLLTVNIGNEDKTAEIEFKECAPNRLVFVNKQFKNEVEVIFQKNDQLLMKAGGPGEMQNMLFTRTQLNKSASETASQAADKK